MASRPQNEVLASNHEPGTRPNLALLGISLVLALDEVLS
jgi:hypothetical protein